MKIDRWLGGWSPRGVTPIFSHICRLCPLFRVQNLEFQYFLGFSEKGIFFGGMRTLWIFFFFWGGGGHHKKRIGFSGHFYEI